MAIETPASTGQPPTSDPTTGSADTDPRFSRALLALVAAITLVAAPISTSAIGPAGSGGSAHSSPVYVLAEAAHDIGHNDWAYEGGLYGRVAWVISYLALGLFWLVVALWIRRRVLRSNSSSDRSPSSDRGSADADADRRLWIRVLTAAWAAETVTGCLTLGIGFYVDWNASTLGPALLRASDLCSPWMSCVAALLVVGLAERRALALRAAALYGVVLAVILLVPVPIPGTLKIVILAAAAAVPALIELGTGVVGAGESGTVESGAAETGVVEPGVVGSGTVESGAVGSGVAELGAAESGAGGSGTGADPTTPPAVAAG
jgi:hypothetical protein